jgi:hypothetical protein
MGVATLLNVVLHDKPEIRTRFDKFQGQEAPVAIYIDLGFALSPGLAGCKKPRPRPVLARKQFDPFDIWISFFPRPPWREIL